MISLQRFNIDSILEKSYRMKTAMIYVLIGWNFAPLLKFIDTYIFADWQFVKFLTVICIVDTILGFYKAYLLHELSSKGFAMVFKKIIVYSAALITTHVFVHFTIANKAYAVFSWFDYVVFAAIMIREVISIFENIAIIDPNAFPKGILKRLKQFDSMTGEFKLDEEKKKDMAMDELYREVKKEVQLNNNSDTKK